MTDQTIHLNGADCLTRLCRHFGVEPDGLFERCRLVSCLWMCFVRTRPFTETVQVTLLAYRGAFAHQTVYWDGVGSSACLCRRSNVGAGGLLWWSRWLILVGQTAYSDGADGLTCLCRHFCAEPDGLFEYQNMGICLIELCFQQQGVWSL